MRLALTSLAVLATLFTAPAARAENKITHVVVLPFTVASGLDPKQGKILDEVFVAELSQVVPEGIELVGSSDVTATLGFEQTKQLSGCDETSCLVEIGNALGASHIIVPSLGKFGEQFIVSTKFLDVQTAKVLHRKVLYVEGKESGALSGVRQSVLELATAMGWQASGTTVGQAGDTEKPATADDGGGDMNPLLLAGAAVAGVGALTAVGLGIGALVIDADVGDTGASWAERESAAGTVLALGIGSGVGLLALIGGGALAGVALAGE